MERGWSDRYWEIISMALSRSISLFRMFSPFFSLLVLVGVVRQFPFGAVELVIVPLAPLMAYDYA